jgi:hypothetical protein
MIQDKSFKISAYLIEGYSETRRMHYIRYLRLYYLMLGTVCGMCGSLDMVDKLIEDNTHQ